MFWARPPDHIVKLATKIQSLLLEAAPSTLMDFLRAQVCWDLSSWTTVHSDGRHGTRGPNKPDFNKADMD